MEMQSNIIAMKESLGKIYVDTDEKMSVSRKQFKASINQNFLGLQTNRWQRLKIFNKVIE